MRNCSKLKETKETSQINAMCDPGLEPRPENKNLFI